MDRIQLTDSEINTRFSEQVYAKPWYEPVPAADGGEPSMLASPGIWLVFIGGAMFWAGVAWVAFRR